MFFDPERVTAFGWHPFEGCEPLIYSFRGLRDASTPGYFLATLRVVNPVDSSSMSLLFKRFPLLARNHRSPG